MNKLLLLTALTGCVHLSHVDPQNRSSATEAIAAVEVDVECRGVPTRSKVGSGVVISERHVLTAAHVVECTDIPAIKLRLSDGSWQPGAVTRIDREHDIALIELDTAGTFGLGVAPPLLGKWEPGSCFAAAYPSREIVCGPSVPGNSGAGVYDRSGLLVGLVTTQFGSTPVDASWLAGT